MCAAEQIMGAYPVSPFPSTVILDMISSKSEHHNPQQTTEAQGQETFSDLQVVLSDIEKSLGGMYVIPCWSYALS